MPNLICCVFQQKEGKMLHTGLHIGDGRVIHCSGEVKEGSVYDAGWTDYAIPAGLYTEDEINESEVLPMLLKKGSSGEEVRDLQELLNKAGYDCGTADGVFGTKTETAVKRFQAEHGLGADGIVGEKTWAMLVGEDQVIDTPDTATEQALPQQSPDGANNVISRVNEHIDTILDEIDKIRTILKEG